MYAEQKIAQLLTNQFAEKMDNNAYHQASNTVVSTTLKIFLTLSVVFFATITIIPIAFNLLPSAFPVFPGLHGSFANIFILPASLLSGHFLTTELGIAFTQDPSTFVGITTNNFIFHNIIPAKIGNLAGGGVIVGWIYWVCCSHPLRSKPRYL